MEKLLLLPLTLLLSFCNGTSKPAHTPENPEQMSQSKTQQQTLADSAQRQQAPITQGITGKTIWVAGNQMPSPDAPPSKGRGIARSLYIYKLTNSSQTDVNDGVFHANIQTELVTKVTTDADGNFAVALAPGKYSLFSEEEQGLYANLFDGENNIFPVEVKKGQVTNVEFLINYKASY